MFLSGTSLQQNASNFKRNPIFIHHFKAEINLYFKILKLLKKMSVSFTFMNFMLNTRNLDKNKILTDTLFYFIKT